MNNLDEDLNKKFTEIIHSIEFQKINSVSLLSTDEEKILDAWKIAANYIEDDDFKENLIIRNKNMMFPFLFPSLNNNYDLLFFVFYTDPEEIALWWLPAFLLHNHNMYKLFHINSPEETREVLEMIKLQYDSYMKQFDKYRKSYITIGPEFAGISYADIALSKLN